MAHFLRRIAPAVLVGTAAVAVAASAAGGAGTEATVNTAAAPAGSTGTAPDVSTPGTNPEAGGSLEEWLHDLDDKGDERDDDDEGSSGGTGSGGNGGGTTATTACDAAEIVGPVVRTEWGPVQVAAKVANGKVCAVRTSQTPDGDRKSVMINARAVPVLEQQVLAAGSASIDGVSGATVTTNGYQKSLQAILDGA